MRKLIQIEVIDPSRALVGLCDDGTLWYLPPQTMGWEEIETPPQDDVPDDASDVDHDEPILY